MHQIDLARADLNLLVVFEALFADRHVGRAAKRLCLSQSATSHALGRLRELFNDPLFVRNPRGIEPTPRGRELAQPIADALAQIRGFLSPVETEKAAFIDQLICVNDETVTLLDKVIERDPQAIIVLQSDHGTAFRGQFKKPFDGWDLPDQKERFGALNALRMPEVCSDEAQGSVDLVNTFARVLNCVSGGHLPDKVARRFVVSHADMRTVHEYQADSE